MRTVKFKDKTKDKNRRSAILSINHFENCWCQICCKASYCDGWFYFTAKQCRRAAAALIKGADEMEKEARATSKS